MRTQRFLLIIMVMIASRIDAMCPTTSPWTTPVQLTTTSDVVSDIVSAGNTAGFMATWVDFYSTAHYSFSSDGVTWKSGLIPPAQGQVASNVDVFVAGNDTGFLVTWVDIYNNAWSSFTADNGHSWSAAQQIPSPLPLFGSSSVYVAAGASGFIATMIGNDNNLYVSFSTGTAAWTASPVQVTFDGSVNNINGPYTQYVSAVIAGNSCMLTWINSADPTYAAFIESINPFSVPTVPVPVVPVGFFESNPIVAYLNGYYMSVARANVTAPGYPPGETYFTVATTVSNWALFSPFSSNPPDTGAGPWVTANQTGFMFSWVVNGNPMWATSNNNGFNLSPECSLLNTPSSTINGEVALSANNRGFVATWVDSSDANAYASFYFTPAGNVFSTTGNIFSPTNLKGAQQVNRFFSQSDYMNVLTWNAPSLGDNPVSYSIYRNAALTDLAGVTQQLQFVDHNRKPGVQYSYYVVSVGASGNMSAPAMITV